MRYFKSKEGVLEFIFCDGRMFVESVKKSVVSKATKIESSDELLLLLF